MKKLYKHPLGMALAVSLMLGLAGPFAAQAATSPSLGAAATYSVLSGAGATNGGTGQTTISGNLGVYPAASYTDTAGNLTIFQTASNPHLGDTSAQNAQAAQLAVFNGPTNGIDATSQPCTVTYIPSDTELSTAGALDPGVYCSPRDFLLSGTLTLHGTGSPSTDVWIFRAARNLVGTAGANVVFTGTGGLPCNVWWRIATTATFTANNTMVGNILAGTSITFGQGATLNGRAFAYSAEVTLLGNTISGPTCTTPPPPASPLAPQSAGSNNQSNNVGSINVVKTVVNDNGGTKTVADFPLFVNATRVTSGITNSFPAFADTYTVTETGDAGYTHMFSGDCDANGRFLSLNQSDTRFCIIANDDIGPPVVVPPVPPLIDLVKVPNPLALPNGPGGVTYTYTLRNVGTVPVTDVTMVGDTCSPIVLASGDTNGDKKLDVNETWVYRCATTLSATHTNTVVATGWANGISATDIANATVVVGVPVIPPLIHVTKIPSPLALRAGGGTVTYTNKVTNPGTVALSNVRLTDDKCPNVTYISGDTNRDSKLDPTETWVYTCNGQLAKTTVNTVTATGAANGLTTRDFAIATVVVAAAPILPNTGVIPADNIFAWGVFLAVLVAISVFFFIMRKKQTT